MVFVFNQFESTSTKEMFVLVACKNNIAHRAIAAAVVPDDFQLLWYTEGGAVPEGIVGGKGDVVILEPTLGWEHEVSQLVQTQRKVWRFGGTMQHDVHGVEWLGDDLLHGLHYAVRVRLVSPLNPQMKEMVLSRLNKTPKLVEDVVLFWLEQEITKGDDDPLTQLTTLWRMDSKSWHSYTRSADLYATYKCIKACWGVQPRTIKGTKFGTIRVVVTPNNIQEHLHAIALRSTRNNETTDFAVAIQPRMYDNGWCVVHWRSVNASTNTVELWKEHHGCDSDGWSGTFSILCDHVQWMNSLETSNLERLLTFMKSKIPLNKTF